MVRPPGIEPEPEPWQGPIITTRPWSQAFLFLEEKKPCRIKNSARPRGIFDSTRILTKRKELGQET